MLELAVGPPESARCGASHLWPRLQSQLLSQFFRSPRTPAPSKTPSISLDMVTTGNSYDETTNTMTVGAVDHCLATAPPGNVSTHLHQSHLIIQDVEDLIGWQVRFNYTGGQMRPLDSQLRPLHGQHHGAEYLVRERAHRLTDQCASRPSYRHRHPPSGGGATDRADRSGLQRRAELSDLAGYARQGRS